MHHWTSLCVSFICFVTRILILNKTIWHKIYCELIPAIKYCFLRWPASRDFSVTPAKILLTHLWVRGLKARNSTVWYEIIQNSITLLQELKDTYQIHHIKKNREPWLWLWNLCKYLNIYTKNCCVPQVADNKLPKLLKYLIFIDKSLFRFNDHDNNESYDSLQSVRL